MASNTAPSLDSTLKLLLEIQHKIPVNLKQEPETLRFSAILSEITSQNNLNLLKEASGELDRLLDMLSQKAQSQIKHILPDIT